MFNHTLATTLAQLVDARTRCYRDAIAAQDIDRGGNPFVRTPEKDAARDLCTLKSGWADKHAQRINKLVADHMPSGSGFDNGTRLDLDASTPSKLVFDTAFHHMDQHGYYDGWTEHRIIVTPSLTSAFDLRITGVNRGQIKDLIHDAMHHALSATQGI
jgi:hypothetical protein